MSTLCIDFYFWCAIKLHTTLNRLYCFIIPYKIFIKLLVVYSFSYNAIKSYKTEGRAEQLEATEYLVSAAEAGKTVCEI